MKIKVLLIIMGAALMGNCCAAEVPAKASPRFKAQITCFNGELDSGSSCSSMTFQSDGTIHVTGGMICGWPGKVSNVKWSFVTRHGTNDVYRFTREFPTESAITKTVTKSVEFSNTRVIVFQDQSQVIVIEPPGDHGTVSLSRVP